MNVQHTERPRLKVSKVFSCWWLRAMLASFWLLAFSSGPSLAAQVMTLTEFTQGDEGWTVINWDGDYTPTKPTWQSTNGNPGGFVRSGDVQGDGFWNAPATLLGDWSTGYGATLSYDAYSAFTGWKMNDIYITGNGQTICYWFPTNPPPQWTTFSVKLDQSAGWQAGLNYDSIGPLATEAQIRSVLSNVTSVRIRQEYAYGADDSGLDNVRLVQGSNLALQFGPTAVQTGSIVLTLQSLRPSQAYRVFQTPNLGPAVTWASVLSFTATNSTQVFNLPTTNAAMFFRAQSP